MIALWKHCKYSVSREEYKISLLIFIAELCTLKAKMAKMT